MLMLYSIKDVVAEEFGPVFQAKNDQVAVRMVNNTFRSTPPGDPESFDLYAIGEFDPEKGVLLPCDPLRLIKWNFIVPEAKE